MNDLLGGLLNITDVCENIAQRIQQQLNYQLL